MFDRIESFCLVAAVIAPAVICCSGSHITPADSVVVTEEAVELHDCNVKLKPDASAQAACRSAVEAKYDREWEAKFDGGGQ